MQNKCNVEQNIDDEEENSEILQLKRIIERNEQEKKELNETIQDVKGKVELQVRNMPLKIGPVKATYYTGCF